jgi:hypothetical protein
MTGEFIEYDLQNKKVKRRLSLNNLPNLPVETSYVRGLESGPGYHVLGLSFKTKCNVRNIRLPAAIVVANDNFEIVKIIRIYIGQVLSVRLLDQPSISHNGLTFSVDYEE